MRTVRRIRRLISKFLGVGWPERFAVVRATVLLLLARTSLALLPFPTILRLASRIRPRVPPSGTQDLRTMVWAVTVVGNRLFPTTPCLTQAVIVHRLLRRSGKPSELRIGVRKDRGGRFGAHAWVESEGEIVIGGKALSEGFAAMPPIKPDRTNG